MISYTTDEYEVIIQPISEKKSEDQARIQSHTIEEESPMIGEWLTFSSYAWNRIKNPHIEAERWSTIFPRWELYEIILKNQPNEENQACNS